MKHIITTITDLNHPSLVTYSNKQGELALGYNRTLGTYNGQTCTLKQAETWLQTDVTALMVALKRLVTVNLNPNQERGLISLIYDIGLPTFTNSKLRQCLNNRKFAFASSCFLDYNTNGKAISISITRRRQIQQNIFNLGDAI